ncbi:ATP-binding cassette domain-containing protein [Flavobacterium gilvum]|uniref:ABC transporter n=1 Tax=Flavobacterium gilvum TaxID=1492737 RepID=A0AAC9I6Y7_9FLAO|nr:ATP-binding cassette domain-containing protein [Flavobacterium gilvum]AOW10875.1 ABC transporter [Flavobacterium gilvum]KFC60136.1 ABC transporter [Flavobacterium gilvum]
MKHWDILLSNQVDKKTFIDTLLSGKIEGELAIFNTLKGILYSDISIQKLIEEEFIHETMEATSEFNRNLRTFSSGERKKEFLKYCLKKNPDYIILDNPMDHLDHNSRIELIKEIEGISHSVLIIQLVNRKIDLLSFISNKAFIEDNSFEMKSINILDNISLENKDSKLPIHSEIFEESVLVQMNSVFVNYDERPIIAPLSWTIKQGEFWHLVGPNGSGKTTLLSLISGENPKGYGQDLILFGRKKGSGESVWDIKKKIGFFNTAMTDLFNKGNKNFSVEDMILSGFFDSIGLYIQPTTLHRKIAEQWLEAIGMTHLKKKIFNRLSIGQQRVVLIARAAIKHPPLLILDEPLEGLDDQNVALVTQLINLIKKETNISILFVSHRMEPNISPDSILELHPSPTGSKGVVHLLKKLATD